MSWRNSGSPATSRRPADIFVGGPGLKPFMDWINDQAREKPPRLSAADAELVVDEAADV